MHEERHALREGLPQVRGQVLLPRGGRRGARVGGGGRGAAASLGPLHGQGQVPGRELLALHGRRGGGDPGLHRGREHRGLGGRHAVGGEEGEGELWQDGDRRAWRRGARRRRRLLDSEEVFQQGVQEDPGRLHHHLGPLGRHGRDGQLSELHGPWLVGEIPLHAQVRARGRTLARPPVRPPFRGGPRTLARTHGRTLRLG
mmetsp:Transcript_137945/g.428703  ORF Transcript_137945/g.428703 Transcript_137945/m.428703 type:complete len:200 (+) Transcript_137945:1207-1806(+)